MAMTPEARVKATITKLLESYNIHRPSIWQTKQADNAINGLFHLPVQNGMGEAGVPDFICVVRGRALYIEAKGTEKQQATAYQQRFIEGVRAAGGLAVVIHKDNIDFLDTIIREIIYGD